MKVVFLEHVLNVGKNGEIKEVSGAYARNFLIPKGLAKQFTAQMEKNMENSKKKTESNRREILGDSHGIIEKLGGTTLTFFLGGSPSGKVYGSVGEKDVISEVKKKFHVELSKKHIDFPAGHLKKFGREYIYIKLGKSAIAKVHIELKRKQGDISQ